MTIPERGFTFISANDEETKERGFTFLNQDQVSEKNHYTEKLKDYGKTIVKGTVEGITQFGRMMSGTHPEEEITPEKQAEILDQYLPTEEDFGQRSLRRGLKMAPSAMAFPGGSAIQSLPRSIAAGFFGEGAKDLGAPEWAQTAAEITAFIGPDVTKKLIEKGSNAEIIKAAKEMGISDEALTPLLQSDFKKKWLSRLIPRRGKAEKLLRSTKEELNKAYSGISQSEVAKQNLHINDVNAFKEKMADIIFKMPSNVRDKIRQDFADLMKNPITGETLMNFYADVNSALGSNTKQLSLLKKPIKEAIASSSPQMAKDFEVINKLYSKYYDIAGRLKPTMKTDVTEGIASASKALSALFYMMTLDSKPLMIVGGQKFLGKLSEKMLFNPRFQQISEKMVQAANANKPAIALKLAKTLSRNVEDIDPDLADELYNLTEEDLQKFFNPSTQE